MYRISLRPVHDHHTHVGLNASLAACLDLGGMEREQIVEALHNLDPEHLHTVTGWHPPTQPLRQSDIDGFPPILLIHQNLHAFTVTPKGLSILEAREPEIMARRLDADWCERNVPRLLGFFGRTAHLEPEGFETFMDGLATLGIDRVDEMLLQSENAWRIMRSSPRASAVRMWTTPRIYKKYLPKEAHKDIRGFKLFLDGALGSGTAALRGPGSDTHSGLLVYSDADLEGILEELHPEGKGVAFHAIGDAAIEQALRVLEQLARKGRVFPEIRIDHAQFVTRSQADQVMERGFRLSMQPNFNADSAHFWQQLGGDLMARNNPFRMLMDEARFVPGENLLFGSDGMPYGLRTLLQWGLFPSCPGQQLTLDELCAGLAMREEGPELGFVVDPAAWSVSREPFLSVES